MTNTLKRLLVLTASLSSCTVLAANCTPGQQSRWLCVANNYHAQDVRNVETQMHFSYYDNDMETYSLGGQYGINGIASVGVNYRDWDDDYRGTGDDSTINISGQYNLSSNIVVHGSYDLNSGNTVIIGGKYVLPTAFGIVDIGGNYLDSDWDSTLEFATGILIPLNLFYYRGDISYQQDWREEFTVANKFGWTNDQFDANLSLIYTDDKWDDDTYFGFEFGYYY